MKKTYIQPSSSAIRLMAEAPMLSGSTQYDLDNANEMNAADAMSNHREQPSGSWNSRLWGNMN